MKLTIDEIRNIKKERVRSYHDILNSDYKEDPTTFQRYNKAVYDGAQNAKDMMTTYANPNANNHQHVHNKLKEASFDTDKFENNCINDSIRMYGAKKFEMKNSAYENDLLAAVQNRSGSMIDEGAIASWKMFMKDKWHACGYESYSDVDATKDFFNTYPLSSSESALERVEKVFNRAFPDSAKNIRSAGLATKNDILNLTRVEAARESQKKKPPVGETEIDKSRRLDKEDKSRQLDRLRASGFAVIANKMAALRGKENN